MSGPLPASAEVDRRRLRAVIAARPHRCAVLVLLILLCATAVAAAYSAQAARDDKRRRVERSATTVVGALDRRLIAYAEVLTAVRALLQDDPQPSPVRFRRFVRSLQLDARYPGVTAVAYAQTVDSVDLGRFELGLGHRRSGAPYPPFAVHPPGDRPRYVVVDYVEPVAGNEPVLGLDLLADPSRAAAVLATQSSGLPAATAPLRLVQDPSGGVGFVYMLAVHDVASAPTSVRAGRMQGVVTAAFKVAGLLDATLTGSVRDYGLRVYDTGSTAAVDHAPLSAARLIYATRDGGVARPGDDVRVIRVLEVGGRRWVVQYDPLSSVPSAPGSWVPWAIAILGASLSLLAAWLFLSLARGHTVALALAGEMTRDLAAQGAQLTQAESMARLGSWRWEAASATISWSDELCRIYGLLPGDHPDSFERYLDRVHPDDRAGVRATIRGAYAGGESYSCRHRLVRPDGAVRLLHCLGEVIPAADGGPPSMVGTAQDITERDLMEADLRRSSRYFDLSRDLTVAIGFGGSLESVNPALADVLGWSPEEFLARRFIDLVHPDDRAETRRALRRLIDHGGGRAESFVHRCASSDGGHRWLDWTAIAAPDEPLIYASARDVTERRRTEVELAAAHEQAVEASRLKSEFFANMSHEIRTPLNGVIGMGGLLADTPLDEEQREYVAAVSASGEALMAVVNDILDFSKIEAGKLELDRHRFELRAAVDDVWSMLATTAHDKNLELLAWVAEDLPGDVYGDSARVRQVLTNLTTNAIKFTAAGDVVLRVTAEALEDGAVGVRFAVTDTGIGVEGGALERIFDAFSQADSSTTRRYGGTGLGLAISRQLVELMGGRIGVDSEPGVGSTFWFTIPLPPAATAADTRRRDFAGARVLIVDENLTSRVILDHQLSAWNLACDTAGRAEEAMGLLREAVRAGLPYGLAVIDVRTPEGDGMALARAIRTAPSLRSTRLLMLSSAGSMREAAAGAGIEAFLTKPVRHSRLGQEIARLVGGGDGVAGRDAGRLRPARGAPGDQGRPVLVAEDNAVNQLVAVRMLEQRGFLVDVAPNGRDAVRMHEAGEYDLIFMDCQMPELDGYAATAEIRRREAPGRHTPIIAMTANTLKGDRERCLAAGMDDYLGKPLRSTDLEGAIARALATFAGARTTGAAAGRPGERSAAPVLDAATLADVFGSDHEARAAIVAEFRTRSRAAIDELTVALATGDLAAAERLAHGLKGSSAAVGAARLSRVAGDLGAAAAAGHLERARAQGVELEQISERTTNALRSIEEH